jgi:hypothetical protein
MDSIDYSYEDIQVCSEGHAGIKILSLTEYVNGLPKNRFQYGIDAQVSGYCSKPVV